MGKGKRTRALGSTRERRPSSSGYVLEQVMAEYFETPPQERQMVFATKWLAPWNPLWSQTDPSTKQINCHPIRDHPPSIAHHHLGRPMEPSCAVVS